MRACQSSPSVERPLARTASRSAATAATSSSRRGGSAAARRSRNQPARAGLVPSVETATITGSRRWTAGRNSAHRSGSSAAFDPDAGPLAVVEHLLLDGRVVGRGDGQPGAGEVLLAVGPLLDRQATARAGRVRAQLVVDDGGDDGHDRSGRQQPLDLAPRHATAPHDQAAPTLQPQDDGVHVNPRSCGPAAARRRRGRRSPRGRRNPPAPRAPAGGRWPVPAAPRRPWRARPSPPASRPPARGPATRPACRWRGGGPSRRSARTRSGAGGA